MLYAIWRGVMSASVPGTVCFSGNALQLSTAGGFRSAVHTTAETELSFSLSSFHPGPRADQGTSLQCSCVLTESYTLMYLQLAFSAIPLTSSLLDHQSLHQTSLQSSCASLLQPRFQPGPGLKATMWGIMLSVCVCILLVSISVCVLWSEIDWVSQVWRSASCLLYCPTFRWTNRK